MVDESTVGDPSPRWLTDEEQQAWRSVMRTAFELGWALERQLQNDSALSLTEYYALAILSAQPERTMRMSELAKLTQSSLSRLSHLVKRLEKRDLVRRQPDPTDGRYTFAILTDPGLRTLQDAAPAHVQTVQRLVVNAIGPDGLVTVARAADTVWETIDAYRRDVPGQPPRSAEPL